MDKKEYDIAVIGGGPAGLSAALTGKIRNKEVVIFERLEFSEKLQKAHLVDNYLGLPQITGKGLMQQFSAHCLAHEPTIIKEKVTNIFPADSSFIIVTPHDTYQAKSVIIATGVVPTVLFAGEKDFLGRGVSYCATCDGMFYKNRDVAIIAYTQEGEHEASYLSELCRNVYYIPRYKGTIPPLGNNVQILTAIPKQVIGDTRVDKLSTDQGDIAVDGVFILRQSDPVENLLPGIELDGEVIKVARNMSTNIPGVFAAGDCTGQPWQIAKAVGDGLVAVLSAIQYLQEHTK